MEYTETKHSTVYACYETYAEGRDKLRGERLNNILGERDISPQRASVRKTISYEERESEWVSEWEKDMYREREGGRNHDM